MDLDIKEPEAAFFDPPSRAEHDWVNQVFRTGVNQYEEVEVPQVPRFLFLHMQESVLADKHHNPKSCARCQQRTQISELKRQQ